ncbi:hypothetical protein B0H19DRAFT_1139090 [Mycena capillaripes]|nr:hypothetical protein B0H19DRAFT_1139090 [Mycena capillaripes]
MQTMAFSLPEEMISEILSLVLKVPDDMFSDISETSPFVASSASTSTILLVNKAWLRVATPLLYNTVVIRSRPQARALATALKGKENLGRFVKKLRVEGGFGKYMQHILERTPQITDLFLSAIIWASDNVSGLVQGLPLLNPTRLIVLEQLRHGRRNKCIFQLFDVVQKSIGNWTNLTTVVLSQMPGSNWLCQSRTLKTVSIHISYAPDYPVLNEMASMPSLEVIELHDRIESDFEQWNFILDEKMASSRLRSLTRVAGSRPPTPEPFSPESNKTIIWPGNDNALFRPMSSAPQSVTDFVWERIVAFAMFATEGDSLWTQRTNTNRLNILLVSKTFKRLALPYLYGYPVLLDNSTLLQFSDRLCAEPALGLHVREIRIRRGPKRRKLKGHLNLAPIFCRAPGLARLIGEDIPMDWDTFKVVARTAGQTLVEFTGFGLESDAESGPYLPTVFDALPALHSLQWNADDGVVPDQVQDTSTKRALPSLNFLDVVSPGLLPALSRMELPALHDVVLGPEVCDFTAFLSSHGHKITHLEMHDDFTTPGGTSVFLFCPELSQFTLNWTCPKGESTPAPEFSFPNQHHSLAKLVVRKVIQGKSLTTDLEEWRRFFEAAEYADFPGLRKIQILYGHFLWPTTEHAISRSLWVKWAERLWERNIMLTNSEDLHWRPRLKGSRRG